MYSAAPGCACRALQRCCAPPPASSLDLLERRPELLDRDLPLAHYTRARLLSAHARAVFVAPDLAPLPAL